jgi:iron complex outermembrane receptor protein
MITACISAKTCRPSPEGKAYTTDGLNSDRVPGTERHLISLQYSDADFYGQNLVSQIYYRDESLTFYPFPTLTKGQVSSFSSSKQDTDQYGAKITLNSQPLDGWDLTWGWMPIMRPLMPTRCSSI